MPTITDCPQRLQMNLGHTLSCSETRVCAHFFSSLVYSTLRQAFPDCVVFVLDALFSYFPFPSKSACGTPNLPRCISQRYASGDRRKKTNLGKKPGFEKDARLRTRSSTPDKSSPPWDSKRRLEKEANLWRNPSFEKEARLRILNPTKGSCAAWAKRAQGRKLDSENGPQLVIKAMLFFFLPTKHKQTQGNEAGLGSGRPTL
jgi:hypothetical protein